MSKVGTDIDSDSCNNECYCLIILCNNCGKIAPQRNCCKVLNWQALVEPKVASVYKSWQCDTNISAIYTGYTGMSLEWHLSWSLILPNFEKSAHCTLWSQICAHSNIFWQTAVGITLTLQTQLGIWHSTKLGFCPRAKPLPYPAGAVWFVCHCQLAC